MPVDFVHALMTESDLDGFLDRGFSHDRLTNSSQNWLTVKKIAHAAKPAPGSRCSRTQSEPVAQMMTLADPTSIGSG